MSARGEYAMHGKMTVRKRLLAVALGQEPDYTQIFKFSVRPS